jgi:hypothetical protein
MSLDNPRKSTFIDEHNDHVNEFQLLISTGYLDYDDVTLGEKPHNTDVPDYSEFTINKFILTKYKIGNPPTSIFHQVWGPVFEIRQFIVQ